MSAHYIPSFLDYLDGSEPAVGVVHANRRCTSLAIHAHGRTGWRPTMGSNGTISVVQVFFYGKCGLARWFTRDEFERVKAERAVAWRRTMGPAYQRERARRRALIEARTTCIMELPA